MIKTLRLQNFKCFEDEVISLSNLNLLTGLNGMGKSSVIQSLLLLRQNFESGLLLQNNRLGLNGDYVQVGTSGDLLYRYFSRKEIGITFTYEENTFSWSWKADDNIDSLIEIAGIGSNAQLSHLPIFSNKFHYLNAERVGPRPYYETSSTKVVHQNQMGVKGEFAANYFSAYRSKKIAIEALRYRDLFDDTKTNDIGLTLYEQLNAWMNIIRPGAQVRIKDQPESGTTTLQFEFLNARDNPGSFRAGNVGFGLTYVFPLLLSVLASEPGTLLLLENPEAHIHPKGQAALGVFLALAAANGVQVVVETHSDHILNGVRYAIKKRLINNEKVRLMFFTGSVSGDKFKHYIDYVKPTEQGKLSHRPNDFFDVWDAMLTRLI